MSRSRSSTQTASSENACGPASRRHTGRSGSPSRNSSSPTGRPAAAEASRSSRRDGRRGRPSAAPERGASSTSRSRAASQANANSSSDSASRCSASGRRTPSADPARRRSASPSSGSGRPRAGKPPSASAGEDDRVEAEAAQFHRGEHRDAVAPDAAVRDARARQQLAQHGRRLGKVDLLAQHCQRLQARRGIARLLGGLGVEHRGHCAGEVLRPVSPACAPGRTAAGADERGRGRLQAQQRRQAMPGGPDLAGHLVFVVDLGAAPRLEVGEPPLQAAAAAREALDPLVGPGHHAGLPGLVQPQRGLAGLAAAAQRPGREQVDDRAPRERLAGRRREAAGQSGQQPHACRPVRLATGRRQARLAQGRRGELDCVGVRHDQRAVPGRRSALDGAHDLSHRLAQLGALVGHGDHGERAVAVEDEGLAAGALAPDRAQALPVVVRRGHREPALLEPEGSGHIEGGESRPGAAGGHRHEHVRPVGDERPDELLLSLVEVVDAVQDDGAGHRAARQPRRPRPAARRRRPCSRRASSSATNARYRRSRSRALPAPAPGPGAAAATASLHAESGGTHASRRSVSVAARACAKWGRSRTGPK